MNKKSNLDKYKNRNNPVKVPVKEEKNIEKVSNKELDKKKVLQKSPKIDKNFSFSLWNKYSKYLPWIVIVITFVVFFNSINNGFLNWDDDRYVTGNQFLDLNWGNVKYFFSEFYFVMYIPLAMFSYMIDYSMVGLEHPWVFHLHNLILHIITTGLVFFFVKKLFENKGNQKFIYAFVVALLFGIHPLHVESVSWIAERKDVLYSMFFMASLLSYLYYVKNRKMSVFALSFVFYVLALFSKTQAVVLPLLMIAIDYYLRDFIVDKKSIVGFLTFKDKIQWKIFAEKIPFFVLSLVFAYIAVKASGTNEPFAESFNTNTKIAVDTGYSIVEKIMLISYSLFLYVAELIIPFKQSAIHPYPFDSGEMPAFFYVFPLFSVTFVVSLVWSWLKQKKEVVFGILFFILNLFIVLHIKNFIISEHYAYLPSIGMSVVLVFITLRIYHKKKALKSIILIFTLLYFGFLSFKTVQRNNVFENSLTFWNDVSETYPQVIVAYYNRGNYLQELGDNVEDEGKAQEYYNLAIEDYNQTIELQANNVGAYSNRGITLAKIGKFQEAVEDFNQVVKIDSTYGNVYSNRGNAFGLLGKWDYAILDYNKALELNPNFEDALFNRGIAYSNVGQNEESIKDFNQVITENSNKLDAYMHRGISLYFAEKIDSAIVDFNTYLNVNPAKYNLIYYRALAYDKKGEVELAKKDFQNLATNYPQIISDLIATGTRIENQADATRNIEFYQKALELFNDILKINPNSSVAYSRIGVIYGKMGDMNAAFKNLNKAIELDNNNAQAFADRGYAYSIIGNFANSLSDYNVALSLKPDDYVTFYNRGLLYESAGNYIKAIEDLTSSVQLQSDYGIAYYRRGVIYQKINKKTEACDDWQTALQLGVADAEYYLNKYCQ
ncbi:MAG: tetratricopeptide repeat protein [Bacteroidales bacterium]|nr:tetratricopeptide repeat protein [Bacteroidales bacterium]